MSPHKAAASPAAHGPPGSAWDVHRQGRLQPLLMLLAQLRRGFDADAGAKGKQPGVQVDVGGHGPASNLAVSALQAACIYYVGIRLLLPGQDPGIDLGREFEMAKGMG